MSKRSNSARAGHHPYQSGSDIQQSDWTKRTADDIQAIRSELGEEWFKRWKLNKNNHGERKRLGL